MISRVTFLVKIKVQVAFKKLVVVTDVQVESEQINDDEFSNG